MPLQIRRGNDAERQAITPAVGELVYVTDTKVVYIGDGTTQGGVPVMNYSTGTIKDLAAEIFSGGSHIGINFTYDTATDKITAVVSPDLTNYQGTITASAFKGSFFADDSTKLLDGIDGSVNLDGTVKTNIVPATDATQDLGTSVNRLRDAWFSRDVNVGSARIEAVGSVINLPAGSTVAGVPIGSAGGEGVVEGGNYKINIVSDDSSIMVNSEFGFFEGDLIGSIKGNVFGADSSMVVDSDTATFFGTLRGAVRADDGSLMYDPTLREISALSVKSNIYSSTNVLMLDHFTNTIFSTFVGNLTGDLRGSVFGADSSMLIDGTNSVIGNANGFTVFENSNIRISASGNIIGKKQFSPGVLDPQVEIGSSTDLSTLVIHADKKSIRTVGAVDSSGFVTPNIEFNISRGSEASPTVVNLGDSLAAISWSAYDGSNYTFAVQTNVVVDPRKSVSAGSVPTVYMIDFPQFANPGDRSFIFDTDGNLYIPTSVNSTQQSFGVIDVADPSLFTEVYTTTAIKVNYTQLVNNAAESIPLFTYPASDHTGGKVMVQMTRSNGDTRIEEYMIFNNTTSAGSALITGAAGGLGTNPLGGFAATFNSGNVDIAVTTDTNNLAGEVIKVKATISLFTIQ